MEGEKRMPNRATMALRNKFVTGVFWDLITVYGIERALRIVIMDLRVRRTMVNSGVMAFVTFAMTFGGSVEYDSLAEASSTLMRNGHLGPGLADGAAKHLRRLLICAYFLWKASKGRIGDAKTIFGGMLDVYHEMAEMRAGSDPPFHFTNRGRQYPFWHWRGPEDMDRFNHESFLRRQQHEPSDLVSLIFPDSRPVQSQWRGDPSVTNPALRAIMGDLERED